MLTSRLLILQGHVLGNLLLIICARLVLNGATNE